MIITLYLPESTANVQHQHVPSRSICVHETNCLVPTDGPPFHGDIAQSFVYGSPIVPGYEHRQRRKVG